MPQIKKIFSKTQLFQISRLMSLIVILFCLFTPLVSAELFRCNDGTEQQGSVEGIERGVNPCAGHGGIAGNNETSTNSTELDSWLQTSINLLSAAVGLVVVASLIFAGIQYMTAGSNASQVAAAKGRIAMSILALILFIFAYGILQWLIPGGIF